MYDPLIARTATGGRGRDGKFPIVVRLADIHPRQVGAIVAHGERTIGNTDHIDWSRTHLNEILVEPEGGVEAHIRGLERRYKTFNYRSRLLGERQRIKGKQKTLKSGKARRAKAKPSRAIERIKENGPQDPWRHLRNSKGPLREGIVAIHRDWCLADENTRPEDRLEFIDDNGNDTVHDLAKYREFRDASMQFLEESFGHSLVYARLDCDEQAVHIQFILCDTIELPPSQRYSHGAKLLGLEANELVSGRKTKTGLVTKSGRAQVRTIPGYELLQDAAGDFFARPENQHLNIKRGEARSKKRREASETKNEVVQEVKETDLPWLEPMGNGSAKGKAMKLLKARIAEEADQKGGVEKIRSMQRYQLAIDTLHALGVVSDKVKHEKTTRKEMAELLKVYEPDFGTPEQIIIDPDGVEKKLEQMRTSKARELGQQIAAKHAAMVEEVKAHKAKMKAEREAHEKDMADRQKSWSVFTDGEKTVLEDREKAVGLREENVAPLVKRAKEATAQALTQKASIEKVIAAHGGEKAHPALGEIAKILKSPAQKAFDLFLAQVSAPQAEKQRTGTPSSD